MSPAIDFDIKERVKLATDIVDLVGSYLQLRRQGAMFVANCPWHDDRKPSLQINPSRQTWTCWVCNIRGDVFNFVMRREGVEFVEALKLLADRAGIPFTPSGKKIVKGSPEDKQILYQAMRWAQQLFQACLWDDTEAELARQYLASRQITRESQERFGLGFCPPDRQWLFQHSRNTQFSPEILEACDLLARGDRGSHFERFRGRLIFPIFDTMNRPIAFGGRLVPGVFPPEHEPPGKYVNSRETRLFSKSETLYGLNLAADETSRTRHLTVVEGYTDVIGLRQAGITGVVAALGTAVNDRHIQVMKRYADRITLLLDGDAAGKKRANEILDYFVAEALDLRILTLPGNQDPFDFVQTAGRPALEAMLAAAPDALEHKIRTETHGIDLTRDTHAANQALERILETLAVSPVSLWKTSTESRLRFEQLQTRLAREFAIDREQLKKRLAELRQKKLSGGRGAEASPASPRTQTPPRPADLAESELLELLLLDRNWLDQVVETVWVDHFSDGPLRNLYQVICDGFHDGRDVSFEGLMVWLEDSALKDLLIRLDEQATAKQKENGFNLDWQIQVVLAEFERRRHQEHERRLKSLLGSTQLAEQDELQALHELLETTRQRKVITAPTEG